MERRVKVKHQCRFVCLCDELVGEIINFISCSRDIFSLYYTCKRFFEFFESNCVYNKCVNVLFTVIAEVKHIKCYVTSLYLEYWGFEYVDKFPNVTSLNLYGFGATNIKIPKTVTSVSLHNVKRELVGYLDIPETVTTVKLRYCHVELSSTKIPETVTSLDLTGNNIRRNRLEIPETVTSLNLSYNNIRDEVNYLQIPKNLESLDLSDNNIGDEGAENLKIPETVTYLNLSYNNIGDEGAKSLKISEKLRILDLRNNHIQAEGVMNMEKRLFCAKNVLKRF